MKQNHRVVIAGVELPLSSDNDERYVQMLAAELSKRINTMTVSAKGISKLEAAIVCALDLLDENCRLRLALSEAEKGGEQ
jgi:cell division protein ZapA (FtsZ GTPase activity inhibitor)